MKHTSLFATLTRSLLFYSALVALVFLAGFVWLYQSRLQEQRADAAERINLLLQVSLENAMLKRDIPGLKDIIERLGRQKGIESVMILNPQGEVRFASDAALLDRKFDLSRPDLCPGCVWDRQTPLERSDLLSGAHTPILRSVKAVANREACSQCHGEAAQSPFNGILVVDHDAQDLKRNALLGALVLAGAGLVSILGLVLGMYGLLARHVLAPVAGLKAASLALAAGDLDRRVTPEGESELAHLGRAFNDMADRLRRLVGELAEREHFVQGLLDALPDGVRVIDADFRIILANRAYHEQFGHGNAPQIGRFCYQSTASRAEPCIPTLVTCPLVALAGSTARLKYQARHHRSDGGEVHVEVNAARVMIEGEAGRRILVIEVMRDLDAEMRISQQQRLAELGQLATGVAHEIRNPLSSVGMLLADAETNLRQGRLAETESTIRLISHEIERCLGITDSLLKLGAPPGLQPQLMSLNEVIGDICSLLRFQAEEAGVRMDSRLDADLRVLSSDSDLRIVLINLMQNAFHAMPEGGSLVIEARRRGRSVQISFTDSGVGIAPENLENIFLPFWSRRADGINGTGLGLSICRAVLKGLGGTIRVESTIAVGTTFTITLPDADFAMEDEHGPQT